MPTKSAFQVVEAAEALLDAAWRSREFALGIAGAAALQVAEVVLVQHHAVVLEAEPAGELRVGRHLLLIDLAVLEDLGDLLVEPVRLLDVALVELEVHLEGLVRDALQTARG